MKYNLRYAPETGVAAATKRFFNLKSGLGPPASLKPRSLQSKRRAKLILLHSCKTTLPFRNKMKSISLCFLISFFVGGCIDLAAECPNENRPKVGVSVLLLREDGKILFGLRKNAHGAGTWGLPGGHLEFNESFEECAAREVFEETGIELLNICTYSFTNDIFEDENKHYVTIFMVSTKFVGEAQLLEPDYCQCWQWFTREELPENLFLPLKNLLLVQDQAN